MTSYRVKKCSNPGINYHRKGGSVREIILYQVPDVMILFKGAKSVFMGLGTLCVCGFGRTVRM